MCDKLAHIVSHVSPKIAFCCALTAFAMQPTELSLQKVRDTYQRKSQAGMLTKPHLQCCSNCASDQGECMKNDDSDKASRDVNIATLYEVERLCGMLRPAYLSADSDFSILFTMCKQYLMKENGEAVQSALVRRKSLPSVPLAGAPDLAGSSQSAASGVGESAQSSKPNILRGNATAGKTVDMASHVNNIAMPEKVAVTHSMVGIHGAVLAPGMQQKTPALPSMQTAGLPSSSVKKEPQQPGRSVVPPGQQASGQNIIQQLVLQQLSSDTVQALLHLIQSGQISPIQLNHIMTKNPNMSVQVLQNIVSRAKQAQKLAAPKQAQQQHLQQVQQQQQQQAQKQQLQQQTQQQQLQQQQQRPSRPSYSMPQVLQSTNLQQSSRLAVQHPTGIRQQTPQQVRVQQPLAQQTVLSRMMGGQMVLQQSVPMQQSSVRPRPQQQQQQPQTSTQAQQQQILRGMQPVRPALPSIPALRLSNTGEIHVTQPLHIMTLRHSAPVQSHASASQNQPILIQTSSHFSGGSVSIQQTPRVLHLPSSASVTPKVIPKAPGPSIAVQGISLGPAQSQAQVSASDAAIGNRHYSINNLLFTGEQQHSALSITLPDTLPEISVDSVSDTLRALSDPPSGSSQIMRKEPVQQVQIPVSQAVSQTASSQVSAAQRPVSSSQAPQRQVPAKAPKQQPPPKKPVRKQTAPAATATPQQPYSTSVSTGSLTQPQQQKAQPYGQPLPSFSSLFTPNRPPPPVPTPALSVMPAAASATPASAAAAAAAPATAASTPSLPSKKVAAGQAKGQKKVAGGEKAGNKGVRKDRESQTAEKEAMMRLLKQAMTIDIEKKDSEEGAGSAYLHIPGQPARSSQPLAAGPKSVKLTQGPGAPGLHPPSSLAGPLFRQQSPQSSRESLSAAIAGQLPSIAQHSIALPTSAQTAAPASWTVARTPSLALQSTVSTSPSPDSSVFTAPTTVHSQQFPPFTPASYSSPKLYDGVANSQAGAQEMAAMPATGVMNPPLPSTGVTASPTLASSAGLIGSPSVSYGPSATHLPGPVAPGSFANSVAAAASVGSVGAGSMKTYSRLDSPLNKSPRQDPLDPVVSIPIPASILPEGGIMETGRDGDQSIATYRCIICAKAFMTLDALRVHVKQICKPGLNQPGGLSNRMAINKAQATEAGLETSTVFQCMRCFELCISEAGIRDHKQVCSKAPKPSKTKAKSRAKPKPPKSEEEQATEAKVMELLNKCLGENREKLLEESKTQAAKQTGAKKRPTKKRPSTEGEPPAASGLAPAEAAPVAKKARKSPPTLGAATSGSVAQGAAPRSAAAAGPESVATAMLTDGAGGMVVGLAKPEPLAEPSAAAPLPAAVTSAAPTECATTLTSTSTCSQAPAPTTVISPAVATMPPTKAETAPASLGDAKEAKPKPKRKYYPRKKKPAENAADGATQPDASEKAGQSESAGKASKAKKSEGSGSKPAKEKKPKKEPGPPPPRYKKVSGSGGRSFFKCTNCGQTLCSVESFGEHWLECIVKKPLSVKPKRAPKAKKPKADSSSSNKPDGATYSSRESIETTIESVASASYTADESEPATALTSKDDAAENTTIPSSKQTASGRNSAAEAEEEEEGSSQATNSSSGTSVSAKGADDEENSAASNTESGREDVGAEEEVPVVFEADAGEVVHELQIETTVEVSTSSVPLVRQPVVVLEKARIPEKAAVSSIQGSGIDGEVEISALSRAEKSSQDVAESSPATTTSPRRRLPKKSASQLRKIHSQQCSSRTVHGGAASKRREGLVKKAESSLTNAVGKPQSGDSKYCGLCKRYFSRRVILIQHIASKHIQPYTLKRLGDSSSYFCHLCQKVFPQFSQYMAHVNCHSQAIVKKFNELESMKELGSPGRSRRIASHKGAVGRSLKKHGRASPKNLHKAGDGNRDDVVERRSRGRPRKPASPSTASTPAADKEEASPSPVNDRRSSGRAAQKQALSKIFISSLGIVENTKRKLSSDERSPAEAKLKRTRPEKSTKDEGDSEEEEEGKAEQSSGEIDDKDEASAVKAGCDPALATTTTTTTSPGSKPAEKASMDASAAQSLANHGPGKPLLSVHCPQSGPLPLNSPPVSSPLTMAPKMPTFLDSFLNFCSSRSPEAPLPLSQSKRRFSYLSTCLDKESFTGASSSSRRSSCDGPTHAPAPVLHPTSAQASSALKPQQCSVSITDILKSPGAKSLGAKVVNIAARRKSAEYDNVYYYGKFEEQLTKQCKVILGDCIHKEAVEEPVISVKRCSVNLGPKVNPADVTVAARCVADQAKKDLDGGVKSAEASEVPDSVPTAAHEVTGDGSRRDTSTASAPESTPLSVCDLGDAPSMGDLPQPQGGDPPPVTNLPQSNEVCVEATLSVLPLPEAFTADADVMALVSAMASQVEEQNPVDPTESVESSSPTKEMVNVSTIPLSATETKAASLPQPLTLSEGAQQSPGISQSMDSSSITPPAGTGQPAVLPVEVSKLVGSCPDARDSGPEAEMNKPLLGAEKLATDDDKSVDNDRRAEGDSRSESHHNEPEIPGDKLEAVVDSPVDDKGESVCRDQPFPDRDSLNHLASYSAAEGSSFLTEPNLTIHGLINQRIDLALLREYSQDVLASSSSSLHSENAMDVSDATSLTGAANEPAQQVELLAATKSSEPDNDFVSWQAELNAAPVKEHPQVHETASSAGAEIEPLPENLETVAPLNPEVGDVPGSVMVKLLQPHASSAVQHIAQAPPACSDVVMATACVEPPSSLSPPATAGPDQSAQVSNGASLVGLSDKIDFVTPQAAEALVDTRYAESEHALAASVVLEPNKAPTEQLGSAEISEKEFTESSPNGKAEHANSLRTGAAEVSAAVDSEELSPVVAPDKPMGSPVLEPESSVPAISEDTTEEAEKADHADEAQKIYIQDTSCSGEHLQNRDPSSHELSSGPNIVLFDVPKEQQGERRQIFEAPAPSSDPSEDARQENEWQVENSVESETPPEAELSELPDRADFQLSEHSTAAEREEAAQDPPCQPEASSGFERQREGQGEKSGLGEVGLTETGENQDQTTKPYGEAAQKTSDLADGELQSVETAPPSGTGDSSRDVTGQNEQQVHDHFEALQEKTELSPSPSSASEGKAEEACEESTAPSAFAPNTGSMSMMDFLQKSAFTVLQGSPAQELSEAGAENQKPSATAADKQETEGMAQYDAETDVDNDDMEDDWDTGNDRVNIITLSDDNQPGAAFGASLSPPVKMVKTCEPETIAQMDAGEQLLVSNELPNTAESGEEDQKSAVFSDPEPQLTAAAAGMMATQSAGGVEEPPDQLPDDFKESVEQGPGGHQGPVEPFPSDLQGPVQQLLNYLQESEGKSEELAQEPGLLVLPDPVPCEVAAHASENTEDGDEKPAAVSPEGLEETASAVVPAPPPDTVAAECSVVSSADQEKSSDDTDPDSDLPELCIVPDSQVIVLSKGVDRRPEKAKTVSSVSDDEDEDGPKTVLSAVVDDHEVKIKNLKLSRPRTRRSATFMKDTYIARVETKEEVVSEAAKEDDEASAAEAARKPLLGLKSLRSMHKPEPFVWEVDGEEDSRKQARNERSLRAFRQKVQVAPFSWDCDGAERDKKQDGEKETAEEKAAAFGRDEKRPAPFSGGSDSTADYENSAGKGSDEAEGRSANKGPGTADCASSTNKDAGKAEGICSASKDFGEAEATGDAKDTGEAEQKRSASEGGGSSETKHTISTTKREDCDKVDCVDVKNEPGTNAATRRSRNSKDKDSSGVDKTSPALSAEITSASTERGRLMTWSRDMRQSGSSDQGVLQTPTRSVSRNRKTASANREKPLRKSRSCDLEGSDVTQFSVEPSTSSKAVLLQETVPDFKARSDSMSKDSSGTGTPSDRKSDRESVSSQPENLQSKVNTRSSEKVIQSPSLRKWRSRHPLCSSTDNKADSADAKTKNPSSRPKIRRNFNVESQKTDSSVSKTDKTASTRPKVKREISTESQQKKMQDGGSISTRSRPSSKNGKLETKLSSSSKSRRSRDAGINKFTESQSSESLQETVNSRRRRTSGTSSSSPTKSLRRGDNAPGISFKKTGERKANTTSAREPTPTPSAAADSVSQVQTSGSARTQRSKDRKMTQSSSLRNVPRALSPPQLKKPDLVGNLDPATAPSLKKDQPATPTTSTLPTDRAGNANFVQIPTPQPSPKERQSNLEPKYLGAMVRRRQQPVSWRTTLSHPAKRLRMTSPKALQYEIIRVEPVRADSPTDHRRTRSSDKDVEPTPRTVHTRVTVDELKPAAHCAETAKTGSDQKWSINRHITPAGLKKRNTDVHFPFSFQRARTRTQTK